MAEKIRKGAVKAYFRMLKVWSALMLGIVGIFCSRDVWAELDSRFDGSEYGVPPVVAIATTANAVIYNQWKGISKSSEYRSDTYQIINDIVCFEKEWKKLGITESCPKADFNKNMVVEIVKKGRSKELFLRNVIFHIKGYRSYRDNYEELKNPEKAFVIFESYVNAIEEQIETSAYLFIVIEKADLPISIQEHIFFSDGKFAERNNYTPTKCE